MIQSDWNIYVCQNIVVNVSKRLKPLFVDPYFQYYEYNHASKRFAFYSNVECLCIQKINKLIIPLFHKSFMIVT